MLRVGRIPVVAVTAVVRGAVRAPWRRASSGGEDGYLTTRQSPIPTDFFLRSLPSIPVPKLEETLARYLDAAAPVVSPDEHARTSAHVKDFLAGHGRTLQASCLELARTRDNYIDDAWTRMYLTGRDPLLIHSNPQLTLAPDADPGKAASPALRAAALTISAVRFYRTLRDGRLGPDLFLLTPVGRSSWFHTIMRRFVPRAIAAKVAMAVGAVPLDNSRNAHLFGTSRVPRAGSDLLVRFDDPAEMAALGEGTADGGRAATLEPARHVIVQRGHRFYPVTVLDAHGALVPVRTIAAAFEAIASAPLDEQTPPLGLLTAARRELWASARTAFRDASPRNAQALRLIESALFAVTLEHDSATDGLDKLTAIMATERGPTGAPLSYSAAAARLQAAGVDPFAAIRSMLHGRARNRWFDKSWQLIVNAAGLAGVGFEHSWGDGLSVLRLCNEAHADGDSLPASLLAPSEADKAAARAVVQPLECDFPPAVLEALVVAARETDALIGSLDYAGLKSRELSRALFKTAGVSPDATAQLVMQLAYFNTHARLGATYESATMAYFKRGRTETIRSATRAAEAFCRAMAPGATATRADQLALLKAAVAAHSRLARDAQLGRGMDRHMFVLRDLELARVGGDVSRAHPLFTDSTYETMRTIVLSTSTLPPSRAIVAGGFGPVSPRCFAVGYSVDADYLGFVISTFGQDTGAFADALASACVQVRRVLEQRE